MLFVLSQFREVLAGQHVAWYIDNTAALHSLVKGMSGSPPWCRLVEAVHILMMQLCTPIWFEFVASADNWSDGISRAGFSDPLVVELGCTCSQLSQDRFWWDVELGDIWAA